jgi:hypothetical protein
MEKSLLQGFMLQISPRTKDAYEILVRRAKLCYQELGSVFIGIDKVKLLRYSQFCSQIHDGLFLNHVGAIVCWQAVALHMVTSDSMCNGSGLHGGFKQDRVK